MRLHQIGLVYELSRRDTYRSVPESFGCFTSREDAEEFRDATNDDEGRRRGAYRNLWEIREIPVHTLIEGTLAGGPARTLASADVLELPDGDATED